MALIACKPIAQVYIGLNLSELQKLSIDVYQALHHAQKAFEKLLSNYSVCIFACSKTEDEHDIIIINAHLNYEPVAYESKQITYPTLVKKIHGAITDIINELTINSVITPLTEAEIESTKQNIAKANQFHSITNKLHELNKRQPKGFKFFINYGESIELVARNFKSETLLIASSESNLDIIQKTVKLLDKLHAVAFEAGANYLDKSDTLTVSEFRTFHIPELPENLFKDDSSVIEVIEDLAKELALIDPKNLIKEHESMLWDAFIRSFKEGYIHQAYSTLED